MKILFDHGTPAPLRNHLREHSVDRSAEKRWELLENGELIRKAEEEGYKVIVTTDQSIRYHRSAKSDPAEFLEQAFARVKNVIQPDQDPVVVHQVFLEISYPTAL